MDGLALREHVRVLAACGLARRQPLHRHAVWGGGVRDLDGHGVASCQRSGQLDLERGAERLRARVEGPLELRAAGSVGDAGDAERASVQRADLRRGAGRQADRGAADQRLVCAASVPCQSCSAQLPPRCSSGAQAAGEAAPQTREAVRRRERESLTFERHDQIHVDGAGAQLRDVGIRARVGIELHRD